MEDVALESTSGRYGSSSLGELMMDDALGHRRQLLASRVAGVGAGVFIFFFFLALCLCVCLVGLRLKQRWIVFVASSAAFAIVALVLLASPKGAKPPEPPQGYDQTVVPLVIIAIVLGLGFLAGLVGMLVFHVVPPLYARPLNYQVDVERKYRH